MPVKGMYRKNSKGLLAPNQRLPHECSAAGRCCFGALVSLLPYDVWRMMISKHQPLAKYGVHNTVEMFDPERNLFQLGLGPESKLPLCFIVPKPFGDQPDGAAQCPFLEWDGDLPEKGAEKLASGELPGTPFWNLEDGSPRFRCGLGAARPLQCELYPFGRMGEGAHDGEQGRWYFYSDTSRCKRCLPHTVSDLGIGRTVQEHIEQPLIAAYLRMTADYIQLMTLVQNEVRSLEARAMLASTIFNFDSILLRQGVPPRELDKVRPSRPEHLIQSGFFLVQTIFKTPSIPDEPTIIVPEKPRLILPGDPEFKAP